MCCPCLNPSNSGWFTGTSLDSQLNGWTQGVVLSSINLKVKKLKIYFCLAWNLDPKCKTVCAAHKNEKHTKKHNQYYAVPMVDFHPI